MQFCFCHYLIYSIYVFTFWETIPSYNAGYSIWDIEINIDK